MDVSQLHVGGYSSLIIVNARSGTLYLFWLKGTVLNKEYKIYGSRPVPKEIMEIIIGAMNITWGHVATFKANGEEIQIIRGRQSTQKGNECK